MTVLLAVACGVPSEGTSTGKSQAKLNAQDVQRIEGNPTCADLGYDFEYKIDNVNGAFSGQYGNAYLQVNATSVDGVTFSFTSNVGVDVVLMKGGSAANAYFYSPETTGDSGLVSPDNASLGAAAISHVTFCYDFEVEVTKTAATSFTRNFDWAVEKTSTTTDLLLSVGQAQAVPYTVVASSTGSTDSDFAVAGSITITNPAPVAALLTGVTDAMGSVTAPVDCGQAFPITLPAGGSLTCTYASALPDASSLTNVATVTTTGIVGGNTGSAAVDFASAAITTVDGCISVTDSMAGALGTVCLADAPKTFSYTAEVGPYTADGCGVAFGVDNVASFSADSGETGSDTYTVAVTVACPGLGCTLTQGYWKTHSSYGPARYDDTWALLPAGADTAFFGSGMSWYQSLWTAPAGSAYLILAHQYAAATLNGLNGADTSAVTAQLAAAQVLLSSYTPSTLPSRLRSQALQLASALDAYNNGLTGPGHCSE